MIDPTLQLCQWYERVKRPLPWRKSHDPYRIWISEVMLQQTQVATVIPYYTRFLDHFPSVATLAKASEKKVLSLWAGLGYYSRARNLRRGAIHILESYNGQFPQSAALLRKVPGIGPYTSGAILSIAFDLPEPIVDGNAKRVFARYYGIRRSIDAPETLRLFWKVAKEWVDRAESPRTLNQAIMELGALVCTAPSPKCELCPLQKGCVAYGKKLQGKIPIRSNQKKWTDCYLLVQLYQNKEKILLIENESGWWKGLLDFPRRQFSSRKEVMNRIESLEGCEILGERRHTVTNHRIRSLVVRLPPSKNIPKGRWYSQAEINSLPVSSLAKKVLALLPPHT